MNTKVQYMGLELSSPIVAGSCGLTSDITNLVRLEEMGAGAVVLRSVFEEEILHDIRRNTHTHITHTNYGDAYEYVARYVAEDSLERHFALIREAKGRLSIPVIGSINCYTHDNWLMYAKRFEEAGCDALEMNMSIYPFEVTLSSDDVERTFCNIIQSLKKIITIPISVKISPYFTDLAKTAQQLSWMGLSAITIFNRSQQVDIDIEGERLCNADLLSHPGELYDTLRWTAVLSRKMRCDLSATTGVSSPEDVVKLILAGAKTVQVASCLYRNGLEYMGELNKGLRLWMERKGYESVGQFYAKLAMRSNENASMLLRTQFMRVDVSCEP